MRSKTILALSFLGLLLLSTLPPATTGAQSPIATPTPPPTPGLGLPDSDTLFSDLIFPLVLAVLAFVGGYLIKRPIDKWLERREQARKEEKAESERKRLKAEERRKAAEQAQEHREITDERAAAYLSRLCEDLRDLKILDMDHPLDLERTYIRVRVHTQTRRAYATATQEDEFNQAGHDPNEWFRLQRAWHTEHAQSAFPPEDAVRQYQHCAILGDPGAGKTTMLQYLALSAAQDRLPDLPAFSLFISLHEFITSGFGSLLDFAAHTLATQFSFPDARPYLEEHLEAGESLLLLDGLDEVNIGADEDEALAHYDRAVAQINTLATRFPQAPIVVTSRFAGWRGGLPASFHNLEILDLGPDDIERFIENWFTQSDPERARVLQRDLSRNARLNTLAANPLLLALICIVYTKRLELPERRAELYRRCVDVLLNQWDASHNIQRARAFTTENKRDLLEHLAWHFHQQGRRYFPRDELLQAIAAFLPQIGLPAEHNDRILAEITAQHGILKQQAVGWYGFLHLTLQEYFAAVEAFQTGQLDVLLTHLYQPWWEEVILLFASQGDAAPLLRRILDQPEDIFQSNLRLAGRCLVGRPRVSDPDLADHTRQDLRARLRAAHFSHEADLIARVLAELGDEESNACLLALLQDEQIDRGVRMSIARVLAELGDEESNACLLALLQDEQIDISVRIRIAAALGALGERAVAPQLLALLQDEQIDSNVRWMIADALGALGERAVAPQLLALLQDEQIDSNVRMRIAAALGALGERAVAPQLLALLQDEQIDRVVRMSIADALGALGDTGAIAEGMAALLPTSDSANIIYASLHNVARRAGVRVLQDGRVVPITAKGDPQCPNSNSSSIPISTTKDKP